MARVLKIFKETGTWPSDELTAQELNITVAALQRAEKYGGKSVVSGEAELQVSSSGKGAGEDNAAVTHFDLSWRDS